MSLVGTLYGLKTLQAKTHAKNQCVIHPLNAPRTMQNFPRGFADFTYKGAMIELVGPEGNRRPAMVAILTRSFTDASGASSVEDMTASLADMKAFTKPDTKQAGHPDLIKATQELSRAYATKIHPNRQEAAPVGIKETKITPTAQPQSHFSVKMS